MTKDEIFAAMEKAYTGAGSTVEGSFAGDLLRACADGCAELWSTEIDGLEERAFVASAAGEWLTRVCADRGVERRAGESDADFKARVLDDIQLSHDRIVEKLGGVTCFAYPFGCSDPDAKALVDALFPVSLMTTPRCADLADGLHDLPRYTVTMKTDLTKLLK